MAITHAYVPWLCFDDEFAHPEIRIGGFSDSKVSLPPQRWDSLQLSHDCKENMCRALATSAVSKEKRLLKRSNSFGIFCSSKASPSMILERVHDWFYTECMNGKLSLRHQVLLGYWIGPEQGDGWGYVEAYLVPSCL
ncbi:hypothetical protein KP509_22G071300 [Ceratopteris richardii]|uniref:Uncharacterized protein n=1 Tax=Ceratopteris richardii TaxID=49495 RepID=A0A8T2S9L2_CERRI|nr:hypothetical protein KP509_22G071300 [Ceratopteris richardii]